jgi:hypothetical protein
MTIQSVGTGRTLYIRPGEIAAVVPHTEIAGASVIVMASGREFDVRGSAENILAAWTGHPVQIRKSA